MAQLQQPEERSPQSSSLAERAAHYRQEIEKVVREIGEHPLYEMKRACLLRNLAEKIEFLKDIQSVATSRIQTEKFLVIGADAGTKSFCSVQNLNEFDEASIRQLLDRYLSLVPDFELFQMTSSDGCAFIFFVIPKQKRRRILARVTVEDSTDSKPKVLLRGGDLWTKGASTGKRLAKPEDWDEIYEEIIETETERRTRQRTAHALEMAIAREKVRPSYGQSSLPSFFTEEEFQALMEDLCSAQDGARFNVLLERLRDDLVEGWREIGAYEESPAALLNPIKSVPKLKERIHEHIKNVFRPAMHWLTLSGMYIVKNSGPIAFLDAVADSLKEVFDTSHQLLMARSSTPYGATSPITDEHMSHTVPAFESLVSLYLIGAYLTKRHRFHIPGSWSPDGQQLAFTDLWSSGYSIWVLRLNDRKAQLFHETPFSERAPQFSPDGHWMAYSSDESGRYEIYAVPYPGPGGKVQISTDGGTEVLWNRNGRELYYRNGKKMMAVGISTQPNFSAGAPKMLFEAGYQMLVTSTPDYDVSPDGQRFLMLKPNEQPEQINVVLNWFEELKQKVSMGKN